VARSRLTITPYRDGPYLVRGPFTLVDQDGREIAHARTVALCRCGRSAARPFCDGTHKAIGFAAPSGPEATLSMVALAAEPAGSSPASDGDGAGLRSEDSPRSQRSST
jgi:CDGSH-type Zn-finger protein